MIDTSMFLFDMDYIFVDVSSATASMICFPIVGYSSDVKIIDFFKNIIFTVQYDRTENSDYVAEIITFLNSSAGFSLSKFKDMLGRLSISSDGNVHSEEKQLQNTKVTKSDSPVVAQAVKIKNTETTVSDKKEKIASSPNTNNQISTDRNVSGSYDIPLDPKAKANRKVKSNAPQQTEKKMTMLHLLSNFSKENLEIYKSQRGQDINKNSQGSGSLENKRNEALSFDIPGQGSKNPPLFKESTSPDEHNTKINKSEVANHSAVVVNSSRNTPKNDTPNMVHAGNFGETTNLSAISADTTVLGGESFEEPTTNNEKQPQIVRSKTGENIKIDKALFKIGKESSYVDYCIYDNSAISRSHANLIIRDQTVYIVDTNSTNHTNVDELVGKNIKDNVKIKKNGEYVDASAYISYNKVVNSSSWNRYVYTIDKSFFESEGTYEVHIESTDAANNKGFSDIGSKDTLIQFVVDRTVPTVSIQGLSSNTSYFNDSQGLKITVVDDVILTRVQILKNNKIIYDEKIDNFGEYLVDGRFVWEEVIPSDDGTNDVSVVCYDAAGNANIDDSVVSENSHITNFLITTDRGKIVQFWILNNIVWFVIICVAIISLISLLVWLIIYMKNRNDSQAD